tara:strand:+ start:545 stop:952 length:408 start_codon:yes stop_codon:yes gene_type:complete
VDKESKDEFRVGFEQQIKQNFYQRPEQPFLQSMGIYHVYFPVRNEEHDFGFLILEWSPEENNTWIGTWVDTEDELNNYKYKRDGSNFVNPHAIARIFAEHMALIHHKEMMKKREEDEEWKYFNHLHKSQPKPYLN